MRMLNQILATKMPPNFELIKVGLEQSLGPSSRDKFASMGVQHRQVRLLRSFRKFAQNFLVIKLARIKGSNRLHFH